MSRDQYLRKIREQIRPEDERDRDRRRYQRRTKHRNRRYDNA